ncbi:dicarboxylate/amino acid:cation symporter [Rhodococcus aerolatus]
MSSLLAPLKRVSFSAQVLLALVVGLVLGLVARATDAAWLTSVLSTVGSTFVTLLTLAVTPLVFTAIVVSIANLRGVGGVLRLTAKTLGWFMATSLVAVLIGIGIGLLTHPGQGLTLTPDASYQPKTTGGWTDFLGQVIPTNPVGAFADGNVLGVLFLAIVVGAAAFAVGEPAEPFLALSRSLLAIVQKALWWVIRLAPLGTAGLIGRAVATYGFDLLRPLATFAAAVYIGCLLVLLVVYPVLVRFVAGLSPVQFFRGAWPAIQLAFVSRSSVGTMPLTQQVTIENLGVPRDYASFAVPLGATTKMDGCAAVYPALAAITVAGVFGVPLDWTDYVLIAFVSVVGSAATAGLTGAIVMLTLTLSTLGLPLAGVGLLIAIDPILDMMRTATNVAGQMVVPVLVSRSEGTLDTDVFDAPVRDGVSAPVTPPARTAVPA